tara:strand:- start:822 stop:1406 length:585 start_codon:yes stop_codon:yes gene_type:complete
MVYHTEISESIYKASKSLLNGEIIIYPTDTLYGFGVDATNTLAIKKLNELKNRKTPYSIIVNSLDMLKKYAILNSEIENKISSMLPGPLTIILNKLNSNLSSLVTPNLNTVGIRIPNHNFILNVVKEINRPVITTSINVHGEEALNDINTIISKYNFINIFRDDVIRDSKGSTIIDFSKKPFEILRQGDQRVNL